MMAAQVQEMRNKIFYQAATLISRCLVMSMLIAGLVACVNLTGWKQGDQSTPFKPPSARGSTPVVVFAPTATAMQDASLLQSTASPKCTDALSFISDLTIPDGSIVQAEERLDKRWRVENSGDCNWMSDYRLKLVSGPAMGAPEEQALYPARSGMQADLRMVFRAPEEAGLYRSAWQAYNPRGEAFGDPFFIEVVVQTP